MIEEEDMESAPEETREGEPQVDNPGGTGPRSDGSGRHPGRSAQRPRGMWSRVFDFLLLFLAVFFGFMADNWRERISENQREKAFIASIVEDLKSDTTESAKVLQQLRSIHQGIDSVLLLLLDPEVMENSNQAYRIWTRNLGLEVFVSNDRTIQQLKSSGEMRLIRNRAVSDRIMWYDLVLKKYYTQSDLMYSAIANTTYYNQLFDFIALHKNPDVPVPLTGQGKRNLNPAYAHLDLWNKGLTGLIGWLNVVHNEAGELLEFIQQEYRLE